MMIYEIERIENADDDIKEYHIPLNNAAAPKVRFSLKRRRFRPYFTAIN
jgi:hypothetical protein